MVYEAISCLKSAKFFLMVGNEVISMMKTWRMVLMALMVMKSYS